jgi:SAM-dependent methyltransferase
MPDTVVPHEIDWTPERIARFWDYTSSNAALADSYFAKMVGPSLLKFVSKRIKIGTAVDIGCGPGDLIGMLIKAGHEAVGVDSSPGSLAKVSERFGGNPLFKGAYQNDGRIDLPDASADSAFMLEVVEHMEDAILTASLQEARRILRPGGHLVLTTPNQENLDASRVMCPECGGIFHRIQHVRTWSADTLRAAVEKLGFSTVAAEPTVLSPYGGPLGAAYKLAYPRLRGRKPHLVYIGRKA